jgi:ribonuclease R
MDAVVTGVDRYGFFCRGTELPAEGLVHVTTLSNGDYYDYDKAGHTLTGRRSGEVFRLGDPVRVRVVRVDLDRRQLDLRLVRHETRRRGESRRSDRAPSEIDRKRDFEPGRRGGSRQRGGRTDRARKNRRSKRRR